MLLGRRGQPGAVALAQFVQGVPGSRQKIEASRKTARRRVRSQKCAPGLPAEGPISRRARVVRPLPRARVQRRGAARAPRKGPRLFNYPQEPVRGLLEAVPRPQGAVLFDLRRWSDGVRAEQAAAAAVSAGGGGQAQGGDFVVV